MRQHTILLPASAAGTDVVVMLPVPPDELWKIIAINHVATTTAATWITALVICGDIRLYCPGPNLDGSAVVSLQWGIGNGVGSPAQTTGFATANLPDVYLDRPSQLSLSDSDGVTAWGAGGSVTVLTVKKRA